MWGIVVGDIAPYEFVRQLKYKMAWRGGEVIAAARNYPSSKLCSACGRRNKTLTLAERRWVCVCGVEHDRDVNAARNLHDYVPTARGARKRQRASEKQPDGEFVNPDSACLGRVELSEAGTL